MIKQRHSPNNTNLSFNSFPLSSLLKKKYAGEKSKGSKGILQCKRHGTPPPKKKINNRDYSRRSETFLM